MLQLADRARAEPADAGPACPGSPGSLAGRAKPGATVLATAGGDDSAAVIAAQPYGLGKVLWVGTDGTWRWRHRVGDAYHHRFWGQVVRWAASGKLAGGQRRSSGSARSSPGSPRANRRRLQARSARASPGVGPDLLIAARVFQADPKPEATARPSPSSRSAPSRASPGRFEGERPAVADRRVRRPARRPRLAEPLRLDPARHAAHPRGPAGSRRPRHLRAVELAAARDPLDLAAATGGRVFADYEADQLPASPRPDPADDPTEETPLWDHPRAFLLFFAILTAEWVARKRVGLP